MEAVQVQWDDAQKAAALDLFMDALAADRVGETRRRIARIAVAFGLMDELLYALGNNVLADLIGGELEPGAGDAGLEVDDTDGDPLDERGSDGAGEDREEVASELPARPPKCEWCEHRSADDHCGNPESPQEGLRVAMAGTCEGFALRAAPATKSVGDRTECPECRKVVTIQAVDGPRYKLRPHRSSPGVNCAANAQWFDSEAKP